MSYNDPTRVTSQGQIPDAPYYVTTTDRFMSGWGPAKRKDNRLIFPCESMAEAMRVDSYAKNRGDQMRVFICTSKPKVRAHHYTQVKTKDQYPNWYKGW